MTTFMQQVVNGLMTGATYAVVALGFGLIFSVMRVLNMAHPDLAMVGAYVAYLITNAISGSLPTLPLLVSILLFIAILGASASAASLGGLVIERLVIRPTRGTYILIPFIATAGVAIFLQNTANTIFGSNPVAVQSVLPFDIINIGGVSFTTMQLAVFLTSIAMMIALGYYVRRTKWGLATRAVAELPEVTDAAVNSALQRARAIVAEKVPPPSGQRTPRKLEDARIREIAADFASALDRGDADALVALLTEDVTWSMPPLAHWYRGIEAVSDFAVEVPIGRCPSWRNEVVTANGRPAVACYLGESADAVHHAWSINVLSLRDDKINGITSFLDPGLFARFGLPPTKP